MVRTNALTTLAILAALAAAACSDNSRPIPGEITLSDAFVADFDLIDMHGEPATDERFDGKPMLIYFGFTSCPDVCPASLGVLDAAIDALGKDADDLHILFITVDPERDDPERLSNFLAFEPQILGLTGTQAQVDEALSNMRMWAQKVPLPDSAAEYTVDHMSLFLLTDREGKPVRGFDDGTPPKDLAERIRTWL